MRPHWPGLALAVIGTVAVLAAIRPLPDPALVPVFGLTIAIGAAFLGGVSSGSLHGFAWFVAVLPGGWIGLRLRPVFGLPGGVQPAASFSAQS